MVDINEIFDGLDENFICVTDFGIISNGVRIDYIYKTDEGDIQIWAGNPEDKYSEELVLDREERRRILEEILEEV